jgi:hypothetical protein
MAAYATGQGKAQQRRTKYGLELWQQQQQLQAREREQMRAFKFRAGLEGQRRQWDLADQRTQRQLELADQQRRRRQQLDDDLRDRRWEIQDREGEQSVEGRHIQAQSLPEVPDWIELPQVRQGLMKERSSLVEALTGGKVDWDDPEQAEKIRERTRRYNESIRRWRDSPPSAVTKANRNLVEQDPVDGRYYPVGQAPNGNGNPTHRVDESGIAEPLPPNQQQQQQAAQQQQQAMEQEAYRERQAARQEMIDQRAHDLTMQAIKGGEGDRSYDEIYREKRQQVEAVVPPLPPRGGGEAAPEPGPEPEGGGEAAPEPEDGGEYEDWVYDQETGKAAKP